MSNKKFISYFHMLYTGLKGTTGAYMASILVLLSAFAATGAEKTPHYWCRSASLANEGFN